MDHPLQNRLVVLSVKDTRKCNYKKNKARKKLRFVSKAVWKWREYNLLYLKAHSLRCSLKIEMNRVYCLLHDLKNFDYNHRRVRCEEVIQWPLLSVFSLHLSAFWSLIIYTTIFFNSTLAWFVISSKLEAQSLTKLCDIIHLNGMFSLSMEYRNAKIHASSFARLMIVSCDLLLIFIK